MTSFFTVWPRIVLTGLALLVVSAPWFAVADSPPNAKADRFAALDGLRGYAALFVFVFHSVLYHSYLLNGTWTAPTPFFYSIAAAAVSLFFMITGYLFWGKLLVEDGRPNWISLYIGRLFRIGPLYLFTISVMLLIVFVSSSFQLREPASAVAKEIWIWAQLGINYHTPDVNGYHDTRIVLNGVTWTLFYEWRFYFCLIFLGLAARVRALHVAVPAVCLVAALVVAQMSPPQGYAQLKAILVSLFCFGMLSASLERAKILVGSARLKNAALLASVVIYFIWGGSGYTPVSTMVLGLLFFLIISGANPAGILTWRVSKRLGDMSFSIYLLQGLVMTSVFSLPPASRLALSSPIGHWAMMTLCAVILLVVSRMTFIYIERPGIRVGKALTKAIGHRMRSVKIGAAKAV